MIILKITNAQNLGPFEKAYIRKNQNVSPIMEIQLINNAAAKQFEFTVDDLMVRIEYIWVKDKIYLTHTEVPKALAGKGVGTAIVKSALEFIQQEDLTLVPLCPFVALYIKRNPEWRKLVLKGINIT